MLLKCDQIIERGNAMKCPTCPDTALVMSDRQGVEIDYCPACRGVWLDRGELDKLIERSTASAPNVRAAPPPGPPQTHEGRRQYRPEYRDSDDDYRYRKQHKKSWLSEIFD